jgi:hypothetical protein
MKIVYKKDRVTIPFSQTYYEYVDNIGFDLDVINDNAMRSSLDIMEDTVRQAIFSYMGSIGLHIKNHSVKYMNSASEEMIDIWFENDESIMLLKLKYGDDYRLFLSDLLSMASS